MIWHIFKKDLKLLWPMVIGAALIHFLQRFGMYELGHFNASPTLLQLVYMLRYAEYLAIAFLIAMVVQQDAVPGVRQDWLVRPIKRRDLLLAKLLFVLLLVQGPVIAADAFEGLINGFSFGQSCGAALSRGLTLFPFLFLAVLAFSALTANLTEALASGVIVFFVGAAVMFAIGAPLFHGRPQFWVEWSGLSWISFWERAFVTLLVAIAILSLMYIRRKVLPSRWIFCAGVFFWILTFFTPWRSAFAVQKWASPSPGTAHAVAIEFAPQMGKRKPLVVPNAEDAGGRIDEATTIVSLPMRISGLGDDTVLKADHYELRVIGSDRRPMDAGNGQNLEIFNEGSHSETTTYQTMRIPTAVYERAKDEAVQFEIDYSLTLFRLAGAYGIPAIHGDQRNPVLGWCKTRVNGEQTTVQLRCMKPTAAPKDMPSCASGFLENAVTGKRNPERFACTPDYSPFMENETDAFSRGGVNLAFRDPTGLAQYPVDGSQLANARAVIRVYRPEEHFSRRVVIPSIRLRDWAAQ